MSAIDAQPFPRAALLGAGALIGASLLLVGGARFEQLTAQQPPAPLSARDGSPSFERRLEFRDGPAGALLVRDVDTGALLPVAARTEGFVRGVGRAMARTRIQHGLGAEAGPFTLRAFPNGGLWLRDEATGVEISLSAFGRDNRAAFSQFLQPEER